MMSLSTSYPRTKTPQVPEYTSSRDLCLECELFFTRRLARSLWDEFPLPTRLFYVGYAPVFTFGTNLPKLQVPQFGRVWVILSLSATSISLESQPSQIARGNWRIPADISLTSQEILRAAGGKVFYIG